MSFYSDIEKTKHYTTKSEEICENLIKHIPKEAKLVEPFVGEGDLKNLFPTHSWETYDIDESVSPDETRDTLLNPPNYKGKWVITNPPYLARNKAADKEIFDTYQLDDMYKIALDTISEAEGGILIIPTNFFVDERTSDVRKKFLSQFLIKEVNIYTSPIFETTTYSVCSFAFEKSTEELSQQEILVNIQPGGNKAKFLIEEKYGFRVAGKFFQEVSLIQPKFSRLMKDRDLPEGKYPTNIKLYAIDTREKKIRLEYDTERFYGISTDRTYATLVSSIPLTEEQQKSIIDGFNSELSLFREEYSDLGLTNYRDYNRKRIGFDFVYRLATKQLINGGF